MGSSGGIAAERGHAHYAASKAGVIALTRAMHTTSPRTASASTSGDAAWPPRCSTVDADLTADGAHLSLVTGIPGFYGRFGYDFAFPFDWPDPAVSLLTSSRVQE